MFEHVKTVNLRGGAALQEKNLQVVSFDQDWNEIYIGGNRRDTFYAVCPNNVSNAIKINVKYKTKTEKEHVRITSSKWCPMEKFTILVLGSQYGIQIHDWDGSSLIYELDFEESGIPFDEKNITGSYARGIAAIGSNLVAVGLHTGEILLFYVELQGPDYICSVRGKFRNHVAYITDLAATSSEKGRFLVSGDSEGCLTIWKETDGVLLNQHKVSDWQMGFPVTTLAIWTRYKDGLVIAGYGSGHIRMFNITTGGIMCEISAHAGWITGMDLASSPGFLITCSEDSYIRIWQLSLKGSLVEHWFSRSIEDSLLTGVKFTDPKGSGFCLAAYDSQLVPLYKL